MLLLDHSYSPRILFEISYFLHSKIILLFILNFFLPDPISPLLSGRVFTLGPRAGIIFSVCGEVLEWLNRVAC
ncbi:MAG: hypothetical protein DRJ11_07315 [Candidatus Aminicenantes bacterium]|nr:MAG: hypothetical protein DRJ11_07315 [Candidatus Aminicenantes bacterium]